MAGYKDTIPGKVPENADYSLSQRLLLLILNYTSIVLLGVVASIVFVGWGPLGWRLLAGVAVLYLVPPLLVRLVLTVSPIRSAIIAVGSADFFKWWCIFNLQVVFCRLPILEELIRMVPGVYSAWLRLWGARIGRLTYWAAGVRILDRSFVCIGDDVVFGAGVRINPHVMVRNKQGQAELLLQDVTIGDRAMIGGYSLLTTGTIIDPEENTRAFLQSPPFSRWRDGRRMKVHETKDDQASSQPGTLS